MQNQSDFVGEIPRYTRNKRRQYQRQRRKAHPQIPGVLTGGPEPEKVNNCQRKRPIKGHVYDSTSEEDMTIKRKHTDASWYKVQVKCENVSPNIEEKHGNKIKQPSLAWNNNRKPNKGDLPQPPLSWLYPNQSRGFYDNQSWNSGGSRQNQSQWEAPVSWKSIIHLNN